MKIFLPNLALVLSFLLLLTESGKCQKIDLDRQVSKKMAQEIRLFRLNSDSLFSEKQQVAIAELKVNAPSGYKLAIAYSDTLLKKTSIFAEEANALVALNGGFFDVEKGGSVAYLEANGKTIAKTRLSKEKWAKTDSLLNGAIILDNSGSLKLEIAKPASFYEQSDRENSVMVAGPMLLLNGKELLLENSSFVKKRHPRSCLCETSDNSILFIAIDGRSESASGMSLGETQQLLLRLNCRNAINLDGGGSTTLWVNDGVEKRIVNHPSDTAGERPVANALLITK